MRKFCLIDDSVMCGKSEYIVTMATKLLFFSSLLSHLGVQFVL